MKGPETTASLIIQGKNMMTSAAKAAMKDINSIKDSASKASKVLRDAFEIGTTVAVVKKLVKVTKDYVNNVTDPKIQESIATIKDSWSTVSSSFKDIVNSKLEPVFAKIAEKVEGMKSNINTISSIINNSLSNVPQALGIVAEGISQLIASVLDWENIKGFIGNIFTNIASLLPAFGQIITSWANTLFEDLGNNLEKFSWFKKLREAAQKQAQKEGTYAYAASNRTDISSVSVGDATSNFFKALGESASTATSSAKNFIGPILEYISTGLATLSPAGQNKVLSGRGGSLITGTSASSSSQEAVTKTPGILDNVLSSLSSGFSSIINIVKDPVWTAIQQVVKGFVDTLGPAINTVIQPLMDALYWIGQTLAQAFFPILDTLFPIISMIANMLMQFISPFLQLIAPLLTPIVAVLEMLSPVLILVGKAFVVLASPVQYLADLFSWLGEWVVFLGSCIGTAIWNITHPFNQKDYGSAPASFSSTAFSGLSERLAAVDNASTASAGLTSGTSTSSAVSSASYNGATNVTINIYQQAPVVGDAGMRTFAQMIKNEFESMNYYGVTA